jgi:hypothetical protein
MSDYKIYVLGNDGHVIMYYDFQGLNDGSALAEANKYAGKSAIEVWQQSRLVGRIGQGESSTKR